MKPSRSRQRPAPPSASSRKSEAREAAFPRLWIAIFAFALVIRVLYVTSIKNAYFFEHLQTEPKNYREWAELILAGNASPSPPYEQAPGFPYFLGEVFRFSGHQAVSTRGPGAFWVRSLACYSRRSQMPGLGDVRRWPPGSSRRCMPHSIY